MDKGKLALYWGHWDHWATTGATGATTGATTGAKKYREWVPPRHKGSDDGHTTHISKLLSSFPCIFSPAVFTGATARGTLVHPPDFSIKDGPDLVRSNNPIEFRVLFGAGPQNFWLISTGFENF